MASDTRLMPSASASVATKRYWPVLASEPTMPSAMPTSAMENARNCEPELISEAATRPRATSMVYSGAPNFSAKAAIGMAARTTTTTPIMLPTKEDRAVISNAKPARPLRAKG